MTDVFSQEERKAKLLHEQILGGDDGNMDAGWAEPDEVKKKRAVHTAGKQVSEFLDLSALRTVDDIVAERLYKEELT